MTLAIILLAAGLIGGIILFIKTAIKNKKTITKLEDEAAQHIADKAKLAKAIEQQSHAIHALEDVMKIKGKIKKEYKEHEEVINKAIANSDADTILVTYGMSAVSGLISVIGFNESCKGDSSELEVRVDGRSRSHCQSHERRSCEFSRPC